jgi:hypothetical protein
MRRNAFAAALLTLPLTAAACGGGSGGGTTTTANVAPTVRAAIAKTAAAKGEHATLTASVEAAGQSVTLSGTGDFDAVSHAGTLHVDFALGGVQTGLDEVLSGSDVYASSPLFAVVLPGGKKWLKVDLRNPPKSLGAAASALASQDPSAALAQLRALSGLREVGTQTIGGVQTTRYRGRIDVSKLPAASAAVVRSSGAAFGPVDVWVGSDGYVHRVRVASTASAGGQKVRTVLAMTLSDFGKQVSVTVPPAAQTADAAHVSIPGLGG